MTLGAHRDDELVGDRRHRARHAMIALHRDRIGIAPNLTAIRQGQAAERVLFLLAVVVHEVHAPIENGGAGVTVAHVNRPQLARLPWLPGSREARRFRANGIPVWSTELRPCARQVRGLAIGADELARKDSISSG